jgi:hypothetical protein
LHKAQLASAAKRRRNRRIAAGVAGTVAVGAVLGAGVYRHKASGSTLSIRGLPMTSPKTQGPMPAHITHRTTITRTGMIRRGIPSDETRHHVSIAAPVISGRRLFATEFTYKHRGLKQGRAIRENHLLQAYMNSETARQFDTNVHGKPVDRSQIPVYNVRRSGTKFHQRTHWPHLTPEQTAEQLGNIRQRQMREARRARRG